MKAFRLLGLLAGLLLCGHGAVAAPAEVRDGDIKLVSFNIRQSGMKDKDGPDRWQKRRKAVVNMFRTEAPDIIGIQEGLIDQVKYIERNCPAYGRIGVGRDDGADGGEIMAVFYRRDRFDLIESGTFWLSETPGEVSRGWDAACNRTVTWALFRDRTDGREFYYLNTHFDHQGEVARLRSAEMVADYIRENIPADAVVIVGGDLNSDSSDPVFGPLKSVLDIAREISDPADRGGTFNGFGSAPGNIVIDHILCRGISRDSEPSLEVLRGNYGAPFISDHYPVVFTFRLK